MAAIPDKIAEIERNIQEGEMMLIVLRRLPESEVCHSTKIPFYIIRRPVLLLTDLKNLFRNWKNIETATNRLRYQIK